MNIERLIESKILDSAGNPFTRRPDVVAAPLRARWDLEQTTPENKNHWVHAGNVSPNGAITPDVRMTLRNRARYETKNSSYLTGMLRTKTNYVVGRGPRLQLMTENETVNEIIQREWIRWCLDTDFARKLHTLYFAYLQDGESFATYGNKRRPNTPVTFTLRVYEADQITEPYDTPQYYDDSRRIDGINLDANGDPISYHVLQEHPGSSYRGSSTSDMYKGRWLSARQVFHLFRPDRPGMARGVPHIASSLPVFAILRRYTLAVLMNAENVANIAMFMKTDMNALASEVQQVEQFLEIPYVRNMMLTIPFGWDVSQVKAEQPVENFVEFHRQVLNEAARCLELPFNVAAGNSSDYNYASGRLDHQMFYKSVEIDQFNLENRLIERVFQTWLREFLSSESGIAPSDIDTSPYRHYWGWDDVPPIDQEKQAKAEEVRWNLGLLTDQDLLLKMNKDVATHYRELERQNEFRRENGLPLPGVAMQAIKTDDNSNQETNDEVQQTATQSGETNS